MSEDLRTFLDVLREADQLLTVSEPVDISEQVGFLLWQSHKAELFKSLMGYPGWMLLGQSARTRLQLALALDSKPDRVLAEVSRRIMHALVASCPV